MKKMRLVKKPEFNFGNQRRLTPISRVFGVERGLCIDRYFIEKFIARHSVDIHGRVLEVGEDIYTKKFGTSHVIKNDVLHIARANSKVSIVADLTQADHIASNTFNCIILTQTLQYIYDVRKAIKTLYRILKPRGVLLATFPGISQISRYDMDHWGEYWHFTTLSAKRLFKESFSENKVMVEAHGNVFIAACFLYGLAAHELKQAELDYRDQDYELLITVRTVK